MTVSGGEDRYQVPDAGLDLGRGALEGRVGGLGTARCRCRIRDAPVRAAGVVGELRAGLASAVAQGDDVVEPPTGERCDVAGPLTVDVDAERLTQHADGVGVHGRSGARPGTRDGDGRGAPAQERLGDR
jgi:hypothetical protein